MRRYCVGFGLTLASIAGAAGAQAPMGKASALVAQPNVAQLAQVTAALGSAPAPLKADVAAATPMLRSYLITLMCVQDDASTMALVGKFVGSRGTNMFGGWGGAQSPGKRMQHHDMVGCVSLLRNQNWRRIAANEFSFDTIFAADDSGESYTWTTVVHKEPDGSWLLAG